MRKGYENFYELLEDVVNTLSPNSYSLDGMPEILETICRFFSFGHAFIYERDHTRKYQLKSYWVSYEKALYDTLDLEAVFTEKELQEVTDGTLSVFNSNKTKGPLEEKICEMFSANSIIVTPINDANGQLAGCIGLADRRKEILLNEKDAESISLLLSIVSNHVKLHIYEQRLNFTTTTMESIMDNTGIDIYVNDFDTHEILYVNKSMAKPYGGLENMMGRLCHEAIYDDMPEECPYCPKQRIIDEEGNPTKQYSWDYERPFDKSWFRVISAAFQWVDGRMAHIISSVDITDKKRYEMLVEEMAYTDNLTGIPNRRQLMQDFDEQVQLGTNRITMFFFDLDRFKEVNDKYGHNVGDELLITIAGAINKDPKTVEKIYRYGGDEFILLFEDLSDDEIQEMGAYILSYFSKTWVVSGHELQCSASIGYASYPEDAKNYQELLDKSDHAMYNAKNAGKNRVSS